MVVLVDTRGGHDPAQRIGVVDEVLTEGLARTEFQFAGDVSDLGSGE
jgi:hypothetical protein